MIEELVTLFKAEEFDKLEKLAYDTPIEELSAELAKLDKDLLVKIFPKLPEDISAECFLLFKSTLQRYLVDNICFLNGRQLTVLKMNSLLPRWLSGKESACQ